jgi:hypothetical protein
LRLNLLKRWLTVFKKDGD